VRAGIGVTLYSGAEGLEPVLAATGLALAPGALREGTPDYFAASIASEPRIGEHVGRGDALNRVDEDLRCPDDAIGQAHWDGRIWSSALWDIRAIFGRERIDPIVYQSIVSAPPGASLADAARDLRAGIEAIASERELRRVDEILEDRGLPTCEPFVDVEPGSDWHSFVPGPTEIVTADGEEVVIELAPGATQARVRPPAGATVAAITVSAALEGLEVDAVVVRARRDRALEYVLDGERARAIADAEGEGGILRMSLAGAETLFVGLASDGDGGHAFTSIAFE
jgi:hypothetical protein